MKKQADIQTAFRTTIKNISPVGSELSDEQLRLVAGGKRKQTYRRGMTNCTDRHGNRSAKPDNGLDT